MSAELASLPGTPVIAEQQPVNQPANDDAAHDAALEAIWNKNERDNGAEREAGKFVSPDPEKREAAKAEAAEGGEGQDGEIIPPPASVPLPANWRGMEATWEKIPVELRGEIATKANELQTTVTEQGRQISSLKPLGDVVVEFKEYFDGTKAKYNPAEATRYLFGLQRSIDQDAPNTILQIIDTYGARDKVAALLGVQPGQTGDSALRQEIAGLKSQLSQLLNPATIDGRIDQKFQEAAAQAAAEAEVKGLSKDKPFYSDIPEVDMVEAIHKARRRLGDTAAKAAVFDLAYDMAVNADPDLRAKAAAAKAAAGHDPAKVDAAKRANGVNVTSTSSGKGRVLTEEEELGAAYDRKQKA